MNDRTRMIQRAEGLFDKHIRFLQKQVFKEVKDPWDALFIICESSRESRNSHKQYEKNLKEKLKQYNSDPKRY